MEEYKWVVSFIASGTHVTEDILTRYKTREECVKTIHSYITNGWTLKHISIGELVPYDLDYGAWLIVHAEQIEAMRRKRSYIITDADLYAEYLDYVDRRNESDLNALENMSPEC